MNQKTLQQSCVGLVLILLGGCSVPETTLTLSLPSATPLAPTATPQALIVTPLAPTATPAPLPDLTQLPQIWFNPLLPMTVDAGRPFTGSDDFMDLFTDEAAWQDAAERVHVFELFGEWVAWNASDEELRQVVTDLNRRGIAIAFGAGHLNAGADCRGGIEGFAGREKGLRIASRIRDAGGIVSFVVFDEPFAFASVYDGPNACNWTAEMVAEEV